jgi:hypothetical protein
LKASTEATAKAVTMNPSSSIINQAKTLSSISSEIGLTEVKTVKRKLPLTQDSQPNNSVDLHCTSSSSDNSTNKQVSPSTSESKATTNLESQFQTLLSNGSISIKKSDTTSSTAAVVTSTNTKTKSLKIEVPSEPPKTVYELERVWRGLKSNPQLLTEYLSIFKLSTFKKVFKESVSPDLISSVLTSIQEFGDSNTIISVLNGLKQIKSFEMFLNLLPENDIICLKSIFTKLEVTTSNKDISDQIMVLKRDFKILN